MPAFKHAGTRGYFLGDPMPVTLTIIIINDVRIVQTVRGGAGPMATYRVIATVGDTMEH